MTNTGELASGYVTCPRCQGQNWPGVGRCAYCTLVFIGSTSNKVTTPSAELAVSAVQVQSIDYAPAPVQAPALPVSQQLPACYSCGNHTLRWENRPLIRDEREPLGCLWLFLVLFTFVGLVLWLMSRRPRVVGYEQILICWTCGATQQVAWPNLSA